MACGGRRPDLRDGRDARASARSIAATSGGATRTRSGTNSSPWNTEAVLHRRARGRRPVAPTASPATRSTSRGRTGAPAGTLHLHELVAVNGDADAALLDFLVNVDLVTRSRPTTDRSTTRCASGSPTPAASRPSGSSTTSGCASSTSARRCRRARTRSTTRSVLELHDAFRPANSGGWLVEGGPDGAQCARTDRDPDLVAVGRRPRRALPRRASTSRRSRTRAGSRSGRAAPSPAPTASSATTRPPGAPPTSDPPANEPASQTRTCSAPATQVAWWDAVRCWGWRGGT